MSKGPSNASPVLWTLRDVRVGTRDRPRLCLDELRVERGATFVLGHSGAGKTTLLDLLVGFARADRGRVQCHLEPPPGVVRCAWAPADGGLWPHLDVRAHLQYALPRPPAPQPSVDQLLADFELTELARTLPPQLSAGERDRLAVARALASGAPIAVLDEPFCHLGPAQAARLHTRLFAVARARDTALVIAGHDAQAAATFGERAIALADGRVVYDGPMETLDHAPPSRALGELLGPLNWLPADSAHRWLAAGASPNGAVGIRPHRLALDADPAGPLRLEDNRAERGITASRVSDVTSGESVVLRHCGRASIPAGTRVVLRQLVLLATLLLGFGAAGCGGPSDEAPPGVRQLSMPPTGTSVPAPRGVAADRDGRWWVLDNVGRVLLFAADGNLLRSWWMPAHDVGRPEGICATADGRVIVADTHYHRLVFFDREGNVVAMRGRHGTGLGEFGYPVRIVQDPHGFLYVAEYGGNDRIQKFTKTGEPIAAFGAFGTAPGAFQRPSGLCWHDGVLYVADAMGARIQRFSDSGEFLGVLETVELDLPYDLCLGPAANLWLVEYGAGRITGVRRDGSLLARYGRAGSGFGELATPWALAWVDDERLMVADTGNHRLLEVRP